MKRHVLKYTLFEHTADVGLHVFGSDMKELFANAAEGLMSLMTEPEKIHPVEETPISLQAESSEALLRAWLAELLYLYHAERKLVSGVSFPVLTKNRLDAVVRGERLDESRHEIVGEVKAVTWHRLKIERTGKGGRLKATLVLDV